MIFSLTMCCWGALAVCVCLSYTAMAFPRVAPSKGYPQQELAAWVAGNAKTLVLAATNVVPRNHFSREFVCSIPRAGPTTLADLEVYRHDGEPTIQRDWPTRPLKEVFDTVRCAVD